MEWKPISEDQLRDLAGKATDPDLKWLIAEVYRLRAVMKSHGIATRAVSIPLCDETKFIGPKGGKSDKGIEDDRLVKGAEVKLVVAGNNKTLREVHLPERKDK